MKSGQLEQHSVSAAFVIGILKALKQFDEALFNSLSDYLKKSNIATVSVETPTKRIDHGQLIQLLDQIYNKSALRRDVFIEIGRRLTASSFSALGYAATSCQSLGLAMATIPIYEKVAITMAVTQLKKSNGIFELTWGCDEQKNHYGLEEIILSAWVQLARNITLKPIQAERVMLTGPIPQYPKGFTDLFGNSLEFNQKQSGIIFNENIMNLEVTLYDPYINELMNQQAQNLQDALSSVKSLYQSVSESIQQALITGQFSQEYIAELHHMSARTLRRGLHKEGSSFQKVLEDVRRNKSVYYLKDPNVSIFEVAMLLGYKEHSTFSAAFKGWYELSPLEFRESKFNHQSK